MSRKEAPRVGLLKALVAGRVTGGEVAAALRVSERQVRRLRRRFEAEGAEGLMHRSRGRPSPRGLPRPLRQRVATLLTTTYRDFNDCHATEKLQEVEGLALSRATVHRWRRALGRPAKHRRRPRRLEAAALPADVALAHLQRRRHLAARHPSGHQGLEQPHPWRFLPANRECLPWSHGRTFSRNS